MNTFRCLDPQGMSDFIVDTVQKLCGHESFRPKLEHLKSFLLSDVEKIESQCKGIIVISGTNGKGETAHALKDLFIHKGQSVAMWTSPHVIDISERFYFSKDNLSHEELLKTIEEYKSFATREKLSFYEFLFFVFIKLAVKRYADYLILEVGLGGRFDGVNIFTNPLCLMTSISKDHVAILGDDLKSILFEKYGITRLEGQLISHVEQKFLQRLLVEWTDRDGINFEQLTTEDDYSKKNRHLALRAFQKFYPDIQIEIDQFRWGVSKGRRERVTINDRTFIFIGAHNLDGHRKMLDSLYQDDKRSSLFVLSFSTGREYDLDDILNLYQKYPCVSDEVFLTSFQGPRAIGEDLIKAKAKKFDLEILENWKVLFDDQYQGKDIYITGSYFFIGEFQQFINAHYS